MGSSVRRALVAVLLLTFAAGCGTGDDPPGTEAASSSSSSGWARAPDVPLSARTDPFLVWTGDEVLVLGGNTGWVCPPMADCAAPTSGQLARDGAAWDPRTGEWRYLPDAPMGLWSGWSHGATSSAVLGDLVVLHDRAHDVWVSYDLATDRWSELESPGGEFADLSAHDEQRLWAVRDRSIVAWDPVTGRVSTEAPYDERPRLQDTRLFLTDHGLVVTGQDYGDSAPDEPTLTQVDVRDGDRWSRFATGQLGWFSHWTGERILGLEPGGADGGEVNGWERAHPYGGSLDPGAGVWRPLDVPTRTVRSSTGFPWDVEAVSGGRVVTRSYYRDFAADAGESVEWLDIGRPDSDVDHNLNAVWADGRLVVFGGIDEEIGWETPAVPELWLWSPPSRAAKS